MADDIIKGVQANSAGFGTISKLAMQDRRLHIAAKAIYAYFNSYAGGGDTCFPSRKKICFDLGISNDTLSKYLRQLTECGYISVEQIKEGGRFSYNIYTLNGTISPCPKISDTEKTVNGKLDTNINSLNINSISNTNREEKKERKKAAGSFDEIIADYTSNEEIKQALVEFIKMRKLMKKPLTDRALTLLLSKLDNLAKTDTEKVAVINQSITRSWAGFFPLKEEYKKQQPAQQPQQETEEERLRREQNEKLLALIEGRA